MAKARLLTVIPLLLLPFYTSVEPNKIAQPPTASSLDVFSLVPRPEPADYTREVLAPLYEAQSEAAAKLAALKADCEASGGKFTEQCILPTPKPTPRAVTTAPLPGNDYKLYIYNRESGNDPNRWNAEGCVGLGQAFPASKLLAVCPNLEYACQDAWFTNYAVARYGSWERAYQHWLVYRSW